MVFVSPEGDRRHFFIMLCSPLICQSILNPAPRLQGSTKFGSGLQHYHSGWTADPPPFPLLYLECSKTMHHVPDLRAGRGEGFSVARILSQESGEGIFHGFVNVAARGPEGSANTCRRNEALSLRAAARGVSSNSALFFPFGAPHQDSHHPTNPPAPHGTDLRFYPRTPTVELEQSAQFAAIFFQLFYVMASRCLLSARKEQSLSRRRFSLRSPTTPSSWAKHNGN